MPRYLWVIALALVAAIACLLWVARSPDEPPGNRPPVLHHPWPVTRHEVSDGGHPWRPHLDKVGLPRKKEPGQ